MSGLRLVRGEEVEVIDLEKYERAAEEAATDFSTFVESYWSVFPKEGQVRVPLRLRAAQQAIEDAWSADMARWGWVRLAVLKYRQARCSTYCCARMQHGVQTIKGITAMSIADKLDLPEQWIRRAKEWYSQTPDGLRPKITASNAIELWFEGMGSRYRIGSAKGQTPGMGLTIQWCHASEPGAWDNPKSIVKDTFQAIPLVKGSVCLIEGTGEMAGDWWSQFWQAANRGESDYRAIFLSWLMDEDYRLAETREIRGYSQREQDLIRLGATDQQLAWRRWKIRNEFAGDEETFASQYPSTPDEAFRSGGRNHFNSDHIRAARLTERDPIWRGDILPGNDPSKYELQGADGGHLLKWAQPQPGRHYALGADNQWGKKDTADLDTAFVECVETGELCAGIRGRFDTGRWALMQASLGHHYNKALLASEENGQGGAQIKRTLMGQAGNSWRYPNLYVRSGDTKFGGQKAVDYCWLTTEHSKADLISYCKTMLLPPNGMDWAWRAAVDELASIVMREDGTIGAPDGMHDDLWMARMITAVCARQARANMPMRNDIVDNWDRLNDTEKRIMEHVEAMDAEDRREAEIEAGQW